jgi:uncharacterized membrane protein
MATLGLSWGAPAQGSDVWRSDGAARRESARRRCHETAAMIVLLLGLMLFLGVHSVRIVAEGFRSRQIARLGANGWKGLYSVASIAGFAFVVYGFGMARQQPVVLWATPTWLRHVAALLTLVSFVLLAAAYVPGNQIKARLHHPMVLGVKVWAFAHLIANNTLADVLLFGAFLVWAVFSHRAAKARDRSAGTVYPMGAASRTAATVIIGAVAWAAFAFWAHAMLIGVRPFG